MNRTLSILVVALTLATLAPAAQADHLGSMSGSFVGSSGLQVTLRWTYQFTGQCCGGQINWNTGDGASASVSDGVSGGYLGDASGSGTLSDGRGFTWVRTRPSSIQVDVTYSYHTSGSYSVTWDNCCAAFSGTIAVTTLPSRAPSAPQNVQATVTSPHTVVLTWAAPSDLGAPTLTEYRIYRDHVLRGAVGASTFTFSDGPQAATGTFGYDVVAFNGVEGPHPPHTNVQIRTPAAPALTVSVVSPHTARLAWTLSDAGTGVVTGYDILRRDPGQGFALRASVAPSVTTFDDTGFTAPGTYGYQVVAKNGFTGPPSTEQTAQIRAPGAPGLSASVVSPHTARLTWAPPADVGSAALTGYDILRRDPGQGFALRASVAASLTTFDDTGFATADTYAYQIVAKNGFPGPPSAERTAQISAPGAVASLASTLVGPHTIRLAWAAPAQSGTAPVTGYQIWRAPAGSSPAFLSDVAAPATSFDDASFPAPGTYVYEVRPTNGFAGPPRSTQQEIRAPSAPRQLDAAYEPWALGTILTWQAPLDPGTAPLVDYIVRRTGPNEPWHDLATVSPSITSFTDTSALPAVTYTYHVTARNGFAGPASTPATSDGLPRRVASGLLEFHGAAMLPEFPCNQPRCFGGVFSGDVSGSLAGTHGTDSFDVSFSTLLAPTAGGGVEATFNYGEFACLAGQQSVLGDAAGSGTITIRPGQISGRWTVPGEQPAIPRAITEIRASFTFTWARALTGAVIQLDTLVVELDVAGLGTRTVIQSPPVPNVGAADFVPHSSGTVPACSTPAPIQGEIAGSVALHA